MIKTLAVTAALALASSMTANAAGVGSLGQPVAKSSQTHVIQVAGLKNRGEFSSGAAKLKRLMRPHHVRTPITQDVRNATGDPNIVVFDHRIGSVFRCSYITYQGKRALQCD